MKDYDEEGSGSPRPLKERLQTAHENRPRHFWRYFFVGIGIAVVGIYLYSQYYPGSLPRVDAAKDTAIELKDRAAEKIGEMRGKSDSTPETESK